MAVPVPKLNLNIGNAFSRVNEIKSTEPFLNKINPFSDIGLKDNVMSRVK